MLKTRLKNDTNLPLAEAVTMRMRDMLLADVSSKDEFESIYDEFEKDPNGFIKEVLECFLTDDQKTISESVWKYPITLVESANAVGKSNVAARIAISFFKIFYNKGVQVYITSAPPEANLKRILWGELGGIIAKSPAVFSGDRISLTDMQITNIKDPQSFIAGVTIPQAGTPKEREARFSGKHSPHLLFIVDECDAVPEEVFKGIEACMSGGFARLLMLFNPRNESGYPYQLKKTGRAHVIQMSALTHPNVLTGVESIPGAVTREKTLQRIDKWTRSPRMDEIQKFKEGKSNSSYFFIPEFLQGETCIGENGEKLPKLHGDFRVIISPEFSYMVLGKYPSISEGQLISREWIEAAQQRWKQFMELNGYKVPKSYSPKAGLDVSDMGDDLNVLCPRHYGFVYPLKVWSDVDPSVSATTAADFGEELGISEFYVDGTGVGASVPKLLKDEDFKAHRIMLGARIRGEEVDEGKFDRVRDFGFWNMREWFRTNPTAMIPDDDKLLEEELLALKYSKDDLLGYLKVTSRDGLKAILRRSADRASALMLTFCPEPPDDESSELVVTNYIKDKDNGRRKIRVYDR